MSLVKCMECNNPISDTADFCSHCGAKVKVLASVQQSPVQSKKTRVVVLGDTHVSGWTVLGTILFMVIFIVIKSGGKGGNDEPKTAPDESSMAFIQCQAFVKERLKAPSTADFGGYLESNGMHDPDANPVGSIYKVASYVDAQNSFGAKLRSTFICTERWNGQDDADIRNWTMEELTFDGVTTDFTPPPPASDAQLIDTSNREEITAFLRPFKTYKHIPLQQLLARYGLRVTRVTTSHIEDLGLPVEITKPGDIYVDMFVANIVDMSTASSVEKEKSLPCGMHATIRNGVGNVENQSIIKRNGALVDISNPTFESAILHWAATGKCIE